ncbi:Bzz1 protein [Starmerella bacillaris]|uniref:Protein BZZ1 n=1 Tax=Starmerella bacillaris TaxID=1247836 RepID=A0AAV5RNB5_STABA|nr:Bzz1 protein [Starmerella bacillaris]
MSIGDSVLDGYKQTSSWVDNGIAWLEDLSEFYKERASIERESAQRLAQLTSKYFDKKAAASAKLSVGDLPVTTPGSLENQSLQTWQVLLHQSEATSQQRMKLADQFGRQVCNDLDVLRSRFEDLSKQFKKFDEHIEDRLKETIKKVSKQKHNYDNSCEQMESARAKGKKSVDSKQSDMYNAKNEYVVQVNIANRMKDKHYHDDIPQLLDAMQRANEARVAQTNRLLAAATQCEKNALENCTSGMNLALEAIEQNKPSLDTQMFVEHNANGFTFRDPPDFFFQPSNIWHDNDAIYTGSDTAVKFLQAMLNAALGKSDKASTASQSLMTMYTTAKESVEGVDFFQMKPQQATPLLRAEAKSLEKLVDAESDRLEIEVEIEAIEAATASVDMSSVPQTRLKTHRTLFGKKKEVVEVTNEKSKSHKTLGLTSLLARTSLINPGSSQSETVLVLYDFTAAGVGELSVQAGNTANLIENDDGTGWVKVDFQGQQGLVPSTYVQVQSSSAGSQPVSQSASHYTTPSFDSASISSQPLQASQPSQAPAPPPTRGSKNKMEALYDYAAQDASQLSIYVGAVITVTEPDDGSGWTTGTLDGSQGIFPTSYARPV